MPPWRWRNLLFTVPLLLLLPDSASADLIKLKNGGEVRGDFDRKGRLPSSTDPVTIRTLTGGLVSVDRADLQFCTRRPLAVEEYETLRKETPATVEDQWELTEWCRKKGLKKERETHLQAILEIDPENENAHRGLGHIQNNGHWTTRDELMRSQGYVKYKGKYILPQEQEILEENRGTSVAEKGWIRKINLWKSWLAGDSVERRQNAIIELRKIVDPNAVPALVKAFRTDPNERTRTFYVKVLTQIDGIKALDALAAQSLLDDAPDVRHLALTSIPEGNRGDAILYYIRELRNAHNAIVVRAAAALEEIGDQQTIPHLIEALVTTHTYEVEVRENVSQTTSIAMNGSSIGIGGGGAVLPPQIEIMARTGHLPYGFIYEDPTKPPPVIQVRTVPVKRTHQNAEVLSALKKFTEEDFGYDKRTWQLWWSTHKLEKPPVEKKNVNP